MCTRVFTNSCLTIIKLIICGCSWNYRTLLFLIGRYLSNVHAICTDLIFYSHGCMCTYSLTTQACTHIRTFAFLSFTGNQFNFYFTVERYPNKLCVNIYSSLYYIFIHYEYTINTCTCVCVLSYLVVNFGNSNNLNQSIYNI